jgi:hypothetical protein
MIDLAPEQMKSYPISTSLTTRFGSTGSSSDTDASQFEPGPLCHAKRERPTNVVAIQERQLACEADVISDVRGLWDSIAGLETITQLWFCPFAQRDLDKASERGYAPEIPELSDNSIEGQLKRFQLQLQRRTKTVSNKHKLLSQAPWRLYLANVSHLYLQEKEAQKERNARKIVRTNRRIPNTTKTRASVFDTFVDYLLPVLQTGSVDTRKNAKTRFDKWLQHGKRWATLIDSYGPAILLLTPYGLTNDR